MKFTIMGEITDREVIARNRGIRELNRLKATYGGRHWRKCKGVAKAEFADGTICDVELHWYEAHGIGRCEEKITQVIR
jgi:hypothetical protein